MSKKDLFEELAKLVTEQQNPASMHIDTASVREILDTISSQDHLVAPAVAKEIPYIEQAVEMVVAAITAGHRLIYMGAGTSGRLGVVDASECPPTFGTDPRIVQGLIAGGREAMFESQEGAEDLESNGELALKEINLQPGDVVCGIAASRRTPYVIGGVKYARSLGCKTLFVTCNPRDQFDVDVDVPICVAVGPEVVMGSTRMKSGTAQKLVLNMITTASFVRMGKVYQNMMIDLQMTNEKLKERAKKIVMTITDLSYDEAADVLEKADYHVKTALVMQLADVDATGAKERLAKASGFVKPAIKDEEYIG